MISAVGQTSVCLMVFICHDITFYLCVSSVINNMMIEGITIRVIFCCDYSSFVVCGCSSNTLEESFSLLEVGQTPSR